jgi:hypothetical protein
MLLSSMAEGQVPGTQSPERKMGGPIVQSGRVPNSTVGQVGQRQTRQQAAQGIAPMARIASRIQNRIETRVHSRIDRGYDPLATGTSAFRVAEKEVRGAGRRR